MSQSGPAVTEGEIRRMEPENLAAVEEKLDKVMFKKNEATIKKDGSHEAGRSYVQHKSCFRCVLGSLSIPGFVFGILGSLSLSLFSIFTKKVLPKLNGEVWPLSYVNNVYASILLLPVMILNNEIKELYNYTNFGSPYFWSIVVAGGLCGFTIGFFTTMQIKYTSALTHNISGTAKACAQTVLATYWYQETKSFLWWSSNIIVLFGSACYTWIKQRDMEKRHRENIAYQRV
uniref:GDP-fucose transporter 1-like n=1 Tax=Diabrotica virgifera virgifera TaxID=50390 RepID=A0A6P7FY28_DIAVI